MNGMNNAEFTELAARCEAQTRVVLHLAVQLEERSVMDGHQFQESLLASLPSGSPVLDRAAELIQELMANYSAARSQRRSTALWSRNRGNPDA